MQQQIVQALIDSCKFIAPPTYQTAIGSTVHYWHPQDVEYGTQCVNIIDEVEQTEIKQLRGTQSDHRLFIAITGIRPTTPATALTDSCNIKSDLLMAVRSAATPSNCKLAIVGSSKEISGEGKLTAQVTLIIEACYRVNPWDF
jgi:hypothetical protein